MAPVFVNHVVISGLLRCEDCKLLKPRDEFPHYKSTGYVKRYCKWCMRSRQRRWREENAAHLAAAKAAYYAKNRVGIRKKQKDYYCQSREYRLAAQRNYRLLENYGLTNEEYEEMLVAAGSACESCGRPTENTWRRMLCVDHDHRDGGIRGLLCVQCNTGIGNLGDSIEGVERALAYLKRYYAARRAAA